jgi:GAF domain-containing protein
MEAENRQRALQKIMEDLLELTSASRTTVRLDMPSENFHLDTVAAEALASGVRSLRNDTSITNLREVPTVQFLEKERRILVQDDCLTADPTVPRNLIDFYGVKAQMLGPLVRDDQLIGLISVHYTPSSREWSEKDVEALQDAIQRTQQELTSWKGRS